MNPVPSAFAIGEVYLPPLSAGASTRTMAPAGPDLLPKVEPTLLSLITDNLLVSAQGSAPAVWRFGVQGLDTS
jgi:hypothetical protein